MGSHRIGIQEEHEPTIFKDARLAKRFEKLLGKLSEGIGKSIPLSCEDWTNTKAAYRFFSNERISEAEILGGHFKATSNRFSATEGLVLVLHDTTEFSYQRENIDDIGITHLVRTDGGKGKRATYHTVCGILMHSSLAVTTDGLPLGLASIKFWTRKKFKGCNELKKKVNPTRVSIEKKESIRWIENLRESTRLLNAPERCIHVGDRESDIYEMFCAAREEGTHFLIRACVDRLAEDGTVTISDEMKESSVKGLHRIEVRDRKGNSSIASIEIKYRRIRILPPIGKQKQYPSLMLTVIYAQERGRPKGRDPIDWKLITDLPVRTRREAIEKLEWYAMRWKIETYHKILKSGCKAEESKLRTAERLTKLISVYCILGWRIFWMTMINRVAPGISAALVFTSTEISLLDKLVANKDKLHRKSISKYLTKLAMLGGYLARSNDPPPGNMVIWRGASRLTDIVLGFNLASDNCG